MKIDEIKVGMYVHFVDGLNDYGNKFENITLGKAYKVEKLQGIYVFITKDHGKPGNFRAERFMPAEQKRKRVFAVGDKVVVADFDTGGVSIDKRVRAGEFDHENVRERWVGMAKAFREKKGQVVTIAQVLERPAADHEFPRYKIQEDGQVYYWTYALFEPVYEGFVEPEKYKAGDKVYVKNAPKDAQIEPRWLPEMDKCVGKAYVVRAAHKGYVELKNGYCIRNECLELFDAKKHKPVKKEALRAVVAKIRKEAINQARGTCSYVIIREGDKDWDIQRQFGDVCHARLAKASAYPAPKGKTVVAVLDFLNGHKGAVKSKEYKGFIDYIQKRSPWSVAYKAKDAKNAIITGLDMNPDVKGDVIAGACIAMRMGSEYPWFLEEFGKFSKLTKNGHVAFLLSFCLQQDKKGNFGIRGMQGGHSVLDGQYKAQGFLKFFKEGYDNKYIEPEEKEKFKNYQNYTVMQPITGEERGYGNALKDTLQQYIHDNVEKKEVGRGWEKEFVVPRESVLNLIAKLEKEMTYGQA